MKGKKVCELCGHTHQATTPVQDERLISILKKKKKTGGQKPITLASYLTKKKFCTQMLNYNSMKGMQN